MKKRVFHCLILAIFSLNLTACGTVVSLAEKDYRPYAGVQRDFQLLQDGGVFGVFAVVDLPLSFLLDTLLLPVSLSQ